MTGLLDTSVVLGPSPTLPDEVAISVITIAELKLGVLVVGVGAVSTTLIAVRPAVSVGESVFHNSVRPVATSYRDTRACKAPVISRKRSASVDLPWSMCAITEKFRMRLGSKA